MNTQAANEAIGLSQSGTKQLQLSGRGISSFLDGSWMSPPACLGKELTVTLSVKEGASEVERERGGEARS